jgi:CO dehydrogenase nickel-insertion accessory protein CooC1
LREKRAELKQKGIEHLGGRCVKCGYDKCIAALDFHHPDPSVKDIDFSKKCEKNWETMKKKIAECIILCANCHREHHWNERQKVYDEEKKLTRV